MLAEMENYIQRIEGLRAQVRDLIVDLPAEALNWRPIQDGDDHVTLSLAVLAAHVAGAEHFWIAEVIGERAPTRDRDGEFATRVNHVAELIHLLDKTAAETREVLSALPEDALNDIRHVRGRAVAVRWGIVHVIDHTALHLGHMQLTYQLWHGGQSKASPYWFDRLPPDEGN
jgi:uncharacterized damage-inducible protein DinB